MAAFTPGRADARLKTPALLPPNPDCRTGGIAYRIGNLPVNIICLLGNLTINIDVTASKFSLRHSEVITSFLFTKDKDTIFFTGVETNEKQNLDNFSRCIMEYNTGIAVNTSFPSFQAALEYVFELAKTIERLSSSNNRYCGVPPAMP